MTDTPPATCICGQVYPMTEDRHAINCPAGMNYAAWKAMDTPMLPVEQCDREAVKDFIARPYDGDLAARVRANALDHETDNYPLVQFAAFLRHRLSTQAPTTGEVDGWQPIESAPHDPYTVILAYWPSALQGNGTVCTAIWSETRQEFSPWHSSMRGVAFTHWRPLPAPPSAMIDAPTSGEGMVTVPREPTEAMVEAGLKANEYPDAMGVWSAMIDAALTEKGGE